MAPIHRILDIPFRSIVVVWSRHANAGRGVKRRAALSSMTFCEPKDRKSVQYVNLGLRVSANGLSACLR